MCPLTQGGPARRALLRRLLFAPQFFLCWARHMSTGVGNCSLWSLPFLDPGPPPCALSSRAESVYVPSPRSQSKHSLYYLSTQNVHSENVTGIKRTANFFVFLPNCLDDMCSQNPNYPNSFMSSLPWKQKYSLGL